jgi:hypothetical protein
VPQGLNARQKELLEEFARSLHGEQGRGDKGHGGKDDSGIFKKIFGDK